MQNGYLQPALPASKPTPAGYFSATWKRGLLDKFRLLFKPPEAAWRINMARNTELNIDINVTKIVKYTCLAGIAIVAVIFIEKAFKEFVKSPCCTKKCTE